MRQNINTTNPCYLFYPSHPFPPARCDKRLNIVAPRRQEGAGRVLKAFTLIELMVVLIIIGILSSIALPGYNRMKERALGKEAIANIKLIAAAERVYRVENGTWYPPVVGGSDVTDIGDINTNLKLSLTAKYWYYAVNNYNIGGNSTCYMRASRVGTGSYLNCIYTFYSNDSDGEPTPNTSCP